MSLLTRYSNLPRLIALPDEANAFWNDTLQVRKVLKQFGMYHASIVASNKLDPAIWGGNVNKFRLDFASVMVQVNGKTAMLTTTDKQYLRTFFDQIRTTFPAFAHADNLPQDVAVASNDADVNAWVVLVETAVTNLVKKTDVNMTGLIQKVFGVSKTEKAREVLEEGLKAIKKQVAEGKVFAMEYGGYDITKVGATSNPSQLRIKKSAYPDPGTVVEVDKKNQLIATLVHESTHSIADNTLRTRDHCYIKDDGFDGASEFDQAQQRVALRSFDRHVVEPDA